MSFQFNGLTASVTITGQLSSDTSPVPTGATKKVKSVFFTSAGAANTLLYTPTGGTTLYIHRLCFSTALACVCKIGDNVSTTMVGGTVYDNCVMSYGSANMGAVVFNFDKPLEIATKLDIFDATAGAKGICVSFEGWEL